MNMKNNSDSCWEGNCCLTFSNNNSLDSENNKTILNSKFSAPFKLIKSRNDNEGRCIVPLLHTAGGLVGGDKLNLDIITKTNTKVLITSTSAQKVYGSIGRSLINPDGKFSLQKNKFCLGENSHLEYLPQETIIFGNGLFCQETKVELKNNSSFIYCDLVRLGRSSIGESIEKGVFQSKLQIKRENNIFDDWEFIDQIELNKNVFESKSGMDYMPVFGSLIWVSRRNFSQEKLEKVFLSIKDYFSNKKNNLSFGLLENGISIRFLGSSTQEARQNFFWIWTKLRIESGFLKPKYEGVWPLQDTI